ncbi:MAG: hypothetical protein A4S14_05610 [Proteobacteria bacterium SG_bin9]|nr:MAG: hypothetical protein A4S14_05610 [Proteobacteria bacterium SG_bin9]
MTMARIIGDFSRRWRKAFRLVFAISLLGCWPFAGQADTLPSCQWPQPPARPPKAIIEIGKVWTGARVDFAATRENDGYAVGYYDEDRWLTIATVAHTTGDIARQRLDTRFAGWDSHNSVALAFDRHGLMHVAANMHAERLNYFRSPAVGEPLARVEMINGDSDLVTYPQFLKNRNGELLFLYRAGTSGNGKWKVRRWDGTIWQPLGDGPFLSDRGFGGHVSAYPSRFIVANDNFVHLAIVWRLTSDASTNVRISYAKTRDFVTWFDSQGRRLAAPLSPETAETVLHTGPNSGLLNNAKVSLGPGGRPVIVFTRFDAQGRNTVELAMADHDRWRILPVAISPRAIPVSGTGSLPDTVAIREVDFTEPERPRLYYRFPGASSVTRVLDPATLASACAELERPDSAAAFVEKSIPTMRAQLLRIGPQATLVWSAQPANNDRIRSCTDEAPRACNPPPSPLRLVIGENPSAGK